MQSSFIVHSGLQLGGLPKYPGEHEQDACPPALRHKALRPHGFGTHGSLSSSSCGDGTVVN